MRAYRLPLLLSAMNLALLGWLTLTASHTVSGQADPAAVQPVLRANTIELVDTGGVVRAHLLVTEDGETLLRMRDANGHVRVKLGASEDGSGMLLANRDAQPGLHVLAKRGATSLTLTDSGGQPRVIRASDP